MVSHLSDCFAVASLVLGAPLASLLGYLAYGWVLCTVVLGVSDHINGPSHGGCPVGVTTVGREFGFLSRFRIRVPLRLVRRTVTIA
jgi:hypothetical protein